MKLFLKSVFCLFLVTGNAQKDFISAVVIPDSTLAVSADSAYQYAQNIKTENLKEIIEYLASDSCEGRELGSAGIDRAAHFISAHFAKNNIEKHGDANSYFQKVGFKWIYWDKLHFKINGVPYKQFWDYLVIPAINDDMEWSANELAFVGYGIDHKNYNDYKNIDVKNKAVLFFKGEPKNKEGNYILNGTKTPSEWSSDLDMKVDAARKHGAKLVLVIEDKFKEYVDAHRAEVVSPDVILDTSETMQIHGINQIVLSTTTAAMLMGGSFKKILKAKDKINRSGKPNAFLIKAKIDILQKKSVRAVKGQNMIAFIEGTDRKDEIISLTAHYDHIGMRGKEVFNGADDNASGTSAVMEIAATLQKLKSEGKGPSRSVLCMLVTGEEKGLLGSLYYVNNPLFPLSETKAEINVDMIGRIDPKYGTDENYIYVIGSDRINPVLHELNVSVNQTYSQLKLDHTFNSELDPNRFYYRSDHYNFAEKGIPSIFFFSGVHDDYHRVTDDAFKINYSKTTKIARHIFLLTWALANGNKI